MSFTLDQARCFIAVAEELHFGRAAERLMMTQPPLSRQIQKLERSVGARLLDRDNRGVSLTPAGQAFLTDAYRLTNAVDHAVARARRAEVGLAGTLRIGFNAISAIGVLGPLLRELSTHLPDIEVILHERVTPGQVDGIRRGELDLGLVRPPFDPSHLSSRVMVREPLYAVVPEGHRLAAAAGPLEPSDFTGEPIISYHPEHAPYLHELTVRYLVNAQVHVVQRVPQVLTAVFLAAAGDGLAFVPRSVASLAVKKVVFKELGRMGAYDDTSTDPTRPVEIHAIWSDSSLPPMPRQVLDRLDAAADHLDDTVRA